jgi:beta-alanine degradation protein BauB
LRAARWIPALAALDRDDGLGVAIAAHPPCYDAVSPTACDSTMSRPKAKPTVQVDNDRVLVTEWRFAPGAETTWHRHGYDYVVVPLTTGKLQLDDGKTERIAELTAGKSYYRPVGVEHNVINANEYEFAFVEIEFKTPQG